MSYLALYRKWRPLVFEEIIDQEHISKTLKNSVKTGRISHAYLFTGTRGTGKTSTAHILSRAINCLDPKGGNPCNACDICRGILSSSVLDVLEIDAASNNSIDNVREIRDEVVYLPSQAKYKVYIIDEVHMLSTGAFNALLKTLEEPPERVVFILATTEPHKVPQTIISRCQRHDFRKISADSIMHHISHIAAENGINVDNDALRLVARLSEGSMRDAVGLLDQCMSVRSMESGNTPVTPSVITYDDVVMLVGKVNEDIIGDMVGHIIAGDVEKSIVMLGTVIEEGKDIARFISDLIAYYRNILLCAAMADKAKVPAGISASEFGALKAQGASLGYREVILSIKELSLLESNLKWIPNPKVMLEVVLIKLCGRLYSTESETLMEKITSLERRLESITSARPSPMPAYIPATASIAASSPSVTADIPAAIPITPAFSSIPADIPAAIPITPAFSSIPADIPAAAGIAASSPSVQTAIQRQPEKQSESQPPKQPVKQSAKQPAIGPAPASHEKDNRNSFSELVIWGEILHEMQNSDKKMLHANIAETSAFELDANTVGIVFKPGSSLSRIIASKPLNTAIIEEAIKKKLGRDIRVKYMDEGSIPMHARKPARQDSEPGTGQSPARSPARSPASHYDSGNDTGKESDPVSGKEGFQDEVFSQPKSPSSPSSTAPAGSGGNGRDRNGDDQGDGETDFVDRALRFAKRIGIPYNDDGY